MSDEKMILRTVNQSEPGWQGHPDYLFWCPGCKCGHGVWVTKQNGNKAVWSFDGNMERPTFAPSLLIRSHEWCPPVTPENLEKWRANPWKQTKVETVCHSFVRGGMIQFLNDCTHELAGKTVPMERF